MLFVSVWRWYILMKKTDSVMEIFQRLFVVTYTLYGCYLPLPQLLLTGFLFCSYPFPFSEAWCDSRLYLDSRARDIRGYRGISIMNNGIISAREIFIRDTSQQNISHQDWWPEIYSRPHKTDCNESCFDRGNVTTSRGAGVTLSRVTRRVTPPALMSYLWRQVNNPPTWPGTRSNFTLNFPVKFKLDKIKMRNLNCVQLCPGMMTAETVLSPDTLEQMIPLWHDTGTVTFNFQE